MTDHKSTRGAAKTAVCHQCYGVTQALSHDRTRDSQHLAHSGSAAWAFVANHDNVAGIDFVLQNSRFGSLFGIEDTRGAGLGGAVQARNFNDAALWSERALQNNDAPRFLDRPIQ